MGVVIEICVKYPGGRTRNTGADVCSNKLAQLGLELDSALRPEAFRIFFLLRIDIHFYSAVQVLRLESESVNGWCTHMCPSK
jgi:hypothetical protein